MKLVDLDPRLYRYNKVLRDITVVVGNPLTWKAGDPTRIERRMCYDLHPVDSIAEAQTILFLCPKCLSLKVKGVHLIECTFANRGVEDAAGSHNKKGQPVRWQVSGTDFGNLSLRPSVLLQGGCNWHGYITNGLIT